MHTFSRVCEFEGLTGFVNRGIHLREDQNYSVFLINKQVTTYDDTVISTNHITYYGENAQRRRSTRNDQLVNYVNDYHHGVVTTPRSIRVYMKLELDKCAAVTKDGHLCKNKCHNDFWMCGKHGGTAYPKIDANQKWVCVGDFCLTYYHTDTDKLKFSLVSMPNQHPPYPIDFYDCLDSSSDDEEN